MRTARLLNVLAIVIFAFPSFSLFTLKLPYNAVVFGCGALVLAVGQFLDFRAARIANRREADLRVQLKIEIRAAAQRQAALLRDLQIERRARSAITAALTDLQQRRTAFLKQRGNAGAWNSYCEQALGAIVKLWRDYYFSQRANVRIRGTLFEIASQELVPVRRSSGGSQFDPAATRWHVSEGVAGKVAEIHVPCLIADTNEEARRATLTGKPIIFAMRPDRPDHQTIRSVFCAPLQDAEEDVRWVLSLDTSEPLPFSQEYYENAADSPARLTEPLLREFTHVLLLRS